MLVHRRVKPVEAMCLADVGPIPPGKQQCGYAQGVPHQVTQVGAARQGGPTQKALRGALGGLRPLPLTVGAPQPLSTSHLSCTGTAVSRPVHFSTRVFYLTSMRRIEDIR